MKISNLSFMNIFRDQTSSSIYCVYQQKTGFSQEYLVLLLHLKCIQIVFFKGTVFNKNILICFRKIVTF